MSKTVSKLALTAGIVLATIFTFSCSSVDDDVGGGNGGGVSSSSVGGQGGGDKGSNIGNYRTVVIGTQTWMAENLNYAVAGSKCFGEGGLAYIYDEETGDYIEKTLSPAEVQANCVKYGRLYDWSTAMNLPSSCNDNSCSSQVQPKHRGICPSGWHIPSDAEWTTLTDYVGGATTAGTKLKSKSGWAPYSGIENLDTYGFSALPGGYGYSDGDFYYAGDYGFWWSATEYYANFAYHRYMNYGSLVNRNDYYESNLFSVRCLQD
jgi:uncharacterized protein (TIGR02145 family)